MNENEAAVWQSAIFGCMIMFLAALGTYTYIHHLQLTRPQSCVTIQSKPSGMKQLQKVRPRPSLDYNI